MKDETRAALKDQKTWLKLPVMLLFYLLLQIVTPVLILVSFADWVILLVTGQRSEGVIEFGQTLAKWYAQTARYLTGGAERRPFPFEDLDCPRDEPVATSRGGAAFHAKTASPESRAQPAAEQPDGVPETTVPKASAGKKSNVKKSGSKKTGSKKSGTKKSASKKSASKKTGSKKSGSKKKSASSPSSAAPAGTDRTGGDSKP